MTYFQQRNQNYSEQFLGNSELKIKVAGCTTCAIYTLNSLFGGFERPHRNNYDLRYSDGNILWQSVNLSKIKFEWRQYTFDRNRIRLDVLNPWKGVLININMPSVPGGKHWLVVLSLGWGGYNCYDPWSDQKTFIAVSRVVGSAHFSKK